MAVGIDQPGHQGFALQINPLGIAHLDWLITDFPDSISLNQYGGVRPRLMRIGINKGVVLYNHQVHKFYCKVLDYLTSCPNLPTEIGLSTYPQKILSVSQASLSHFQIFAMKLLQLFLCLALKIPV